MNTNDHLFNNCDHAMLTLNKENHILLSKMIKRNQEMFAEINKRARSLDKVDNFFNGKAAPANFATPTNLLLYFHDFCHPKTIISSRYMLIIPLTALTYIIEGESYSVQVGQAILVSPYLQRSVPDLHQDHSRLIISFEAPDHQVYLPSYPLMTISDSARKFINDLLAYYSEEKIPQALMTLTLLLLELSHGLIKTEEKAISSITRRAQVLINQYLSHSFTIKEIADKIDVSQSHLRRVFRREIGVSLGDYLMRHRVNAARRFLIETTQSVETIARHCGYDSVYSFSRFFRNKTGMSPSAYRKRQLFSPADY